MSQLRRENTRSDHRTPQGQDWPRQMTSRRKPQNERSSPNSTEIVHQKPPLCEDCQEIASARATLARRQER